MRPRRTDTTEDTAQLYAAHRVALVRLGFLLTGDARLAETATQEAFVRLLRRPRRHEDTNEALDLLRASVLAQCRAVHAPVAPALLGPGLGAQATTVEAVRSLSQRQRAAVVLASWAGVGTRQIGRILGVRDDEVETARRAAAQRLRCPDETATETEDRVAEALQRAATAVHPADLTSTFADVVAAHAHTVARQRRARFLAGALAAAVALGSAAGTFGRKGAETTPTPSPAPTITPTRAVTTTSLGSPALGPGDRPRSAIPWQSVGRGWAVVVTAAPPNAVTTTMLLVAPDGTRYPVGTSPDGMVVEDVSADGRTALLAIGSQAYEWDLAAGTSRRLGTAYGWKTLRYAGPRAQGYLVLWTDGSSQVRLEHWDTDGRLRAEYPVALTPVAGSPGTPALVVTADGRDAYLASREGGVLVVDLTSDAVGHVPLPAGGCVPHARGAANEVIVVCSGTVLTVAPDRPSGRPVDPVPPSGVAGAWQATQRLVVQVGTTCSAQVVTVDPAGRAQSLTETAATSGLVPNGVAGDTLYLGGTRCADDGSRLVAYDLTRGVGTELVGEAAGGRTVRQAVLVQPLG